MVIEAAPPARPAPVGGVGVHRGECIAGYVRTLRGRSACGHPVRVRLTVRRFVCQAPACSRRTFVEQVAGATARYRRATVRVASVLRAFGVALGGEAGSRLAGSSGVAVGGDALLRLLRRDLGAPRIPHAHERLERWRAATTASGVPDLMTFADGLRRERTESLAALTLPWSTGPVAGHITRLKPIERQGYGRAGLDTLQRRLLRAARSRKGRKSHQTESTRHMTVLAERVDVVIGIDTHKHTHTAAVVLLTGGVLGQMTMPSTGDHATRRAWALDSTSAILEAEQR